MSKITNNKYGRSVIVPRLNETTQEQKAVAAIHGSNQNIRNFCIISPQNPMYATATKIVKDPSTGKDVVIKYSTMTPEENEIRMDKMKSELRRMGFRFYSVFGRYGTPEKSLIIYNIPLEYCVSLGMAFDQESFIMGKVKKDDDRFVTFEYYEKPFSTRHNRKKGEPENKYNLIVDETKLIDLTDEENRSEDFTEISKKFKFNIPFSIFNEAFKNGVNEIDLLVESRKANYPLYAKNYDDLLEGCVELGLGGKHSIKCRSILYWNGIDKFLEFFDISNQGRKADLEEQRRAK